MKIIGLMSGTSVDGIDAAIVEVSGTAPHLSVQLLTFLSVPYSDTQRQQIFALFDPQSGRVDRICEMNFAVGEWFAAAALQVITKVGLTPADIQLIGSHGQTIYHCVGKEVTHPATLQIGEAAIIAERTGITTIADFRVADIAAGGQGAPLVSYVDWLLLRHGHRIRAVQNIGGIANVTYLPAGDDPAGVLAFDTGPGNMLIDEAVRRITGGRQQYDEDGRIAASGRVHSALLAELMQHPYLQQPPPKTTGREEFGVGLAREIWAKGQRLGLAPADIVATLTAFTARSIAEAYQHFLPAMPEEVLLCGGGAQNPTLVAMLRQYLAPARVLDTGQFGLPSDAKEAIAFAVLAYETAHARPGNLPSCTGARHSAILGKITPGRNFSSLPFFIDVRGA
ncbi:MAG: anhydro-N-acetylmuramic acid kinase [Chloroflexi bacterium]|nr:anhydro-N-acetylmuramic acid kinase [Chloroflexota bacterium]